MESFERTPLNMRGVLDEVHGNKWLGKRLIFRKTDTQNITQNAGLVDFSALTVVNIQN